MIANLAHSVTSEDYPCLVDTDQVLDLLRPRLAGQRREHMVALYLDQKSYLLAEHMVAGHAHFVDAGLRALFARGLSINASALILAHNHPSGDATPSAADIAVTRDCARVGRLLSLPLRDHFVFGDNGRVTSFRSLGLL